MTHDTEIVNSISKSNDTNDTSKVETDRPFINRYVNKLVEDRLLRYSDDLADSRTV
jgi:hypothetical protein